MGQKIQDLKILVTGGQGFLGGALVRALVRHGYSEVTATARRPAPELEALGVTVMQADLSSRRDALNACQGQEWIFHTAAKAGVWGRFADYQAINMSATDHLLEGAARNGCHFVHTSSPSVTFAGRDELGVDESAPYSDRPLNPYCFTKIRSEAAVLRAHGHSGVRSLALRPHLIYGPGDPHLLPRVFEAAEKGRLIRVGDGSNWVDVTHIDDAVAAHLAVLHRRGDDRIWGQPYFITSGRPVQLWHWLDELLRWRGLAPVGRSLPLPAAVVAGIIAEWVYRVLPLKGEPPLTRFSAMQLGCSHTYSIDRARQLLGYDPQVDPYSPFETQRLG